MDDFFKTIDDMKTMMNSPMSILIRMIIFLIFMDLIITYYGWLSKVHYSDLEFNYFDDWKGTPVK